MYGIRQIKRRTVINHAGVHKRQMEKTMHGVPSDVLEKIDMLPEACRAKGITQRQLSDASRVEMSIIAKYMRHEKWPCRSRYNRIAQVLEWKKWR